MNHTTSIRSTRVPLGAPKLSRPSIPPNRYELILQILAVIFEVVLSILASNGIANLKLRKSLSFFQELFTPSPKHHEPKKTIKVIIAGLPRTGTISMKTALQELGYKNCFHLAEPLCQFENLKRSAEIVHTKDTKLRRERLAVLLEGHEATLEVPGSACLPDLLEMYPDAKVVLTERTSAEVWLRSWHGFGIDLRSSLFRMLGYWVPGIVSANDLYRGWVQLAAERFDLPAPEPSVEMYHAHNAWVKSIVPKERLLEFKCQDGWEPLCDFLGRQRPNAFPHGNESGYLKYYKRVAMVLGFALWVLVIAVMLFGVRLLKLK
ncbi:hypothetical protein PFICI_10962 [Pestalotiopsis fici W106-1]|uniref:P-loop containing nucleoside triphosphate hydrolase protein n=1 Tax=Pestalotiopsis fici (strain W106-1 / CGMCC3.15140) TaxID=1229662 RepID=W3WT92_PESFW|nr:uncharacterized protein PFICI_10962 [Pestalotiopsis fici W106-1]ETS77088.1 hypothetical protein PFICI_10962 [Pestalotiopsis fici W106-1]